MTIEDFVYLKGTLKVIEEKEFQCRLCLSKYKHYKNHDEMNEGLKKTKGCEKELPKPIFRIGEELTFTRCVGNFYSESAYNWLDLFVQYEKGVMPFPGAMVDQPNKVIEIFKVIESYKQAKLKQEHDKQMRAINSGRK